MCLKRICSLSLVLGSLIAVDSWAEFVSCATNKIDKIMVQGERDDNHVHANSFVMTLKNAQCNNKPYLMLKNDRPSYQSMLAIALAAKMADKDVDVIVNTSKVLDSATEISIIIIK